MIKHTINPSNHRQAGFTLNEILAALTIATIIMGVATALFFSFQSMWSNSSRGHTLDAEKKQLSAVLSGKLASSVRAEISQDGITMTTEEGQILKLTLSDLPGGNLQKLTYTITDTSATFTISEHVASVTYNGSDLRSMPTSYELMNGEPIHLIFTFNWGKKTEVLDSKLKLLDTKLDE